MEIKKHFTFSILFFLAAVVASSLAYMSFEGWAFLDSLYFTVMTITTIGYGDLVPLTIAGKIFTIVFSFFGIAMAFYFMALIGRYLFHVHVNERFLKVEKN